MSAAPATQPGGFARLGRRAKILLIGGGFLLVVILLGVIFPSEGRNEEFQPQNEFKLDPWIEIKIGSIDMSINKAVLYLFLASALTILTLRWVANRMQDRPNRVQTAVEAAYSLMKDNIAGGNMDRKTATRWFAFIGTLFLFIWFSNMIGYLPLPTNTEHKINIFGIDFPAFALYAATANISVTLALTLVVWISYHVQGIRSKGLIRYLKGWVPEGITGFTAVPIFGIEVISHFVRVISLSVRLFANLLAGHLLILFMGGGLVVLLGIAALGVLTIPVAILFFLFEVLLIATLQAFIFSTLTAIYLGESVAEHH